MIVLYADVIFLINTLVDYLVLLVTGRLAGIPLKRKRFFAAALLGGTYALAAVLPKLSGLNAPLVKLPVWFIMVLIAYGYSDHFIKEVLLAGIVSCVLAGIVLALGILFSRSLFVSFFPEECRRLLLVGICFCLVCSVLFRSFAQSKLDKIYFPVSISIAGREVTLTALLDTGNQLRDDLTGQPLLVVSPCALQSVLPKELSVLLSKDCFRKPADIPIWTDPTTRKLKPKLIPYRALGVPEGVLLALQTDWIQIQNTIYPHANVAIAPQDLGLGYTALWGGRWKGASSKYDFFEKTPAMDTKTAEQ